MKRLVAFALAAVLVFGLCGCTGSANARNFGEVVQDWNTRGDSSVIEPSEIVTYKDGKVGETLGFDVTCPTVADIKPIKFFAIDGWFCQVEYKAPDERVLVVRVAREEAKNLILTYDETHNATSETRTVDGAEVLVRTGEKGCTMVSWVRDGFQFIAHSSAVYDAPTTQEIDGLVAGLRAADV